MADYGPGSTGRRGPFDPPGPGDAGDAYPPPDRAAPRRGYPPTAERGAYPSQRPAAGRTGYQPGGQPPDAQRRRRVLGPYGPREEGGPAGADSPYAAPGYGPPGYQPTGYGPPPGSSPAAARVAAPPWERAGRGQAARRDPTGGAEGNTRLTGITGAVLLLLFAAEGFTLLSIHQMITLHFFLGMLLLGPVALKAASVCYRFARYYTGAPQYRRNGPPAPLLRLIGPFVLLLSLAVLGTGVLLGVTGQAQPWLFLHKATFVLWFGVMTIHVLAYIWRLPALIGPDLGAGRLRRAQEVIGGRRTRWLLLAASLAGGLVIALATVHWAGPWTTFHHGG